jgi:sec-independent protein translocase protein TatB
MGTPQIIEVANLGMADSLILMVMALVVFGPRRLPQIGRQIGKLMYEFRKASNDFKYQMEEELRNAEEADRRKKEEERLKQIALTVPATTDLTQPVETVTGSQGPDGMGATPSPYPGEEVYPPEIKTDETSVAEPAQAEAGAEERPIRVEPPSVGEQVPAARPWNLEEKLAELNIPGPEVVSSDDIKKAATESTPVDSGSSSAAAEQAVPYG